MQGWPIDLGGGRLAYAAVALVFFCCLTPAATGQMAFEAANDAAPIHRYGWLRKMGQVKSRRSQIARLDFRSRTRDVECEPGRRESISERTAALSQAVALGWTSEANMIGLPESAEEPCRDFDANSRCTF